MDVALTSERLPKMKVVELPSHKSVAPPPEPQYRNAMAYPQIDGRVELLPGSVLAGATGKAAKRPSKGSFTGYQYLATDTYVLSVWTGSAWKTTTLT